MLSIVLYTGTQPSQIHLDYFVEKNRAALAARGIVVAPLSLYRCPYPGIRRMRPARFLPANQPALLDLLSEHMAQADQASATLVIPLFPNPRLQLILSTLSTGLRGRFPEARQVFCLGLDPIPLHCEMILSHSVLVGNFSTNKYLFMDNPRRFFYPILAAEKARDYLDQVVLLADLPEAQSSIAHRFSALLRCTEGLDFSPPPLTQPLRRDAHHLLRLINPLFAVRDAGPFPWRGEPGLPTLGEDSLSLFSPEEQYQLVQASGGAYERLADSFADASPVRLIKHSQKILQHQPWSTFAGISPDHAARLFSKLTLATKEAIEDRLCQTPLAALSVEQKQVFCHITTPPAVGGNPPRLPLLEVQGKSPAGRLSVRRNIEPYGNRDLMPWLSDEQCKSYSQVPIDGYGGQAPHTEPLVSILTPTYNHAAYIEQNILSVAAQQTAFPFRHVIVDDGSNDGTADIIRHYAGRYPHIVPVLLKRNSKGGASHRRMFELAASRYVAICDGDDYFLDPNKLQTQVDLMEANPQYALCFHRVKVVYQNGKYRDGSFPDLSMMPRGVRPYYYLSDLLKWNMIQTNAVLYRWRFPLGLPEWFRTNLLPNDWYWHLLHAETGKIAFINKEMSVYRRHEQSLYYTVVESRVRHRIKTGKQELKTFRVLNRHFNGKYEKIFLNLGLSVFCDIALDAQDSGDDSLLNSFIEDFPEFAKYFLQELQANAFTVETGRSD